MSTLHATLRHNAADGKRDGVGLRVAGSVATLLLGAAVLPLSDARAALEEEREESGRSSAAWPQAPRPETDAIVVTGEKVNRSIYDTGSSVEVYDSRRLESTPGVTVASDLLKMTSNVVDTGIGNDLPTVRGIDGTGPAQGAHAFLNGSRARLNMAVDGRSLTYNELAFGPQSMWDIERVEVFRGPQSLLQGRNSIAGAVLITSKDPTFHWEQAVKGGIGNRHYSQTAAMVSGPLVDDELAFRVSVDRQRRRSSADLTAYAPVGDPREIEVTTSRAKLLYNPAALPELTTKLSLNHYDTRAPQNEATSSVRFETTRPVFETKSTSGIWDIAWEASDSLQLENKLLYTDFDNQRLTSNGLQSANIDGKEFQLEPLARFGGGEDRLRALAGLRYFYSTQDEWLNFDAYYGGVNTFDDRTESFSAFAEATYAVVPKVDVTLGGRLEREERRRQGGSSNVAIDFDKSYNVFLPKAEVVWKPRDGQAYGGRIARGYNAGGAGMTFLAPFVSYTYDAEYVWNYELFSRHQLKDSNVELTTNIFYNDYKDMQLPVDVSGSSVILNADKVKTYGAELGARWTPAWEFDLFGSVGLLKSKIESFSGSELEGNRLARAPGYTANLGARYRFARGFELSGNVAYSDSYYSNNDNDRRGRISSYWTTNLQLAYAFKQGRATLFAQNLFDHDDSVMSYYGSSRGVAYLSEVRPDRLVGASLELTF
ncbi:MULTISPECIES: TonB-dependent receptor [Brenneria]|uniref:TonB-dependent receptor n=1 Tax=Brenneria nigrifluens DSM 30175 = ATCC 13028 TaxID=1121120 RepID=A0A2U1UQS6_9GAMM|nr:MULTISPECIES: TonB-dependent receptor [Brenneria]EHD22196.1 TonB-dependent siderophore receptor [Brenneria sp. EniD312]PWC24028.1 TonB-dependent receptor [Brenneria nigrifluens] [Brenneria nigrifluens DSM 30175 = ATCC 13028]QCR05222.1 TonB-dependent receptor [Brenneria nigrifluens] [Brenneria nigrifluens DSM 30175 = ATCC 13028]